MIQQPSLDRFSQPGPNEKRYGVKVLLLPAECHVCGQHVDPRFLQPFPGAPDIEACKYCINETTEEAEKYVSTNH